MESFSDRVEMQFNRFAEFRIFFSIYSYSLPFMLLYGIYITDMRDKKLMIEGPFDSFYCLGSSEMDILESFESCHFPISIKKFSFLIIQELSIGILYFIEIGGNIVLT